MKCWVSKQEFFDFERLQFSWLHVLLDGELLSDKSNIPIHLDTNISIFSGFNLKGRQVLFPLLVFSVQQAHPCSSRTRSLFTKLSNRPQFSTMCWSLAHPPQVLVKNKTKSTNPEEWLQLKTWWFYDSSTWAKSQLKQTVVLSTTQPNFLKSMNIFTWSSFLSGHKMKPFILSNKHWWKYFMTKTH